MTQVAGWVLVTWPDGETRVYTLVDYCALPGAAVAGTNAIFITRAEYIRRRAASTPRKETPHV